MKGERAIDEIAGLRLKRQMFQIRARIDDGVVARHFMRAGQHLLRQVKAQNLRRACVARPATEPAEAAAEIDDLQPLHLRQQGPQRWPLRSALQAFDRAAKAGIALKEVVIVVNVLGHHVCYDAPHVPRQ